MDPITARTGELEAGLDTFQQTLNARAAGETGPTGPPPPEAPAPPVAPPVAPAEPPPTPAAVAGGAPPAWGEIVGQPSFQEQTPVQKLVTFSSWHDDAYNHVSQQPDWVGPAKDSFNKQAADTQAQLQKDAGGITPGEARVKIAEDALALKTQELGGQAPDKAQVRAALAPLGPDVVSAYFDSKTPANDDSIGHQLLNAGRVAGTELAQTLPDAISGIARKAAASIPIDDKPASAQARQFLNDAADFWKERSAALPAESAVDPHLGDTALVQAAKLGAGIARVVGEGYVSPALLITHDMTKTYGQVANATGDNAKAERASKLAGLFDGIFLGQGVGVKAALDQVLPKGLGATTEWAARAAAASGGNLTTGQVAKAVDAASNAEPGQRMAQFTHSLLELTIPDAAQAIGFGIHSAIGEVRPAEHPEVTKAKADAAKIVQDSTDQAAQIKQSSPNLAEASVAIAKQDADAVVAAAESKFRAPPQPTVVTKTGEVAEPAKPGIVINFEHTTNGDVAPVVIPSADATPEHVTEMQKVVEESTSLTPEQKQSAQEQLAQLGEKLKALAATPEVAPGVTPEVAPAAATTERIAGPAIVDEHGESLVQQGDPGYENANTHEKLLKAAIENNHPQVDKIIAASGITAKIGETAGHAFVTSDGYTVDRTQGLDIARAAGQLRPEVPVATTELQSQHLAEQPAAPAAEPAPVAEAAPAPAAAEPAPAAAEPAKFENDPNKMAELLDKKAPGERIYIPEELVDNETIDPKIDFAFEKDTGRPYLTGAEHTDHTGGVIRNPGELTAARTAEQNLQAEEAAAAAEKAAAGETPEAAALRLKRSLAQREGEYKLTNELKIKWQKLPPVDGEGEAVNNFVQKVLRPIVDKQLSGAGDDIKTRVLDAATDDALYLYRLKKGDPSAFEFPNKIVTNIRNSIFKGTARDRILLDQYTKEQNQEAGTEPVTLEGNQTMAAPVTAKDAALDYEARIAARTAQTNIKTLGDLGILTDPAAAPPAPGTVEVAEAGHTAFTAEHLTLEGDSVGRSLKAIAANSRSSEVDVLLANMLAAHSEITAGGKIHIVNLPDANWLGTFHPPTGDIYINVGRATDTLHETILHEISHLFTKKLFDPASKLTPAQATTRSNVEKLHDFASRKIYEQMHGQAPTDAQLTAFQAERAKFGGVLYGLADPYEFVVSVLTNANFRATLSSVEAHPDVHTVLGKFKSFVERVRNELVSALTGKPAEPGSLAEQAIVEALSAAVGPESGEPTAARAGPKVKTTSLAGAQFMAASESLGRPEDAPRITKEITAAGETHKIEIPPNATPEQVSAALRVADKLTIPPADKQQIIDKLSNRLADTKANTTYGVSNARVDAQRAARGLPAKMEPLRRATGAAWDEAMAHREQNPEAGNQLVKEVLKKPRTLRDWETALLAHEQVTREHTFDNAIDELNKATTDAQRNEANNRIALARAGIESIYEAADRSGTEAGRSLAIRRILVQDDYSLARMEAMKRAANEGKPLTEEQAAKVADAHAELADLKAKLDAAEALQKEHEAQADLERLAAKPGDTAVGARVAKRMKEEGIDPDVRNARNLARYKKMIETRRIALEAKLEARDFSKVERTKTVLDQEALDLQVAYRRSKLNFDRELAKDVDARRPWPVKVASGFVEWVKAAAISSPLAFGKLTAAAVARVVLTPIESASGAIQSKIPGLSEVFARAPREGGASLRTEGDAFVASFTKGLKDIEQIRKTGQTDLDVLYGKQSIRPRGALLELIGRMHYIVKAPIKRAEFERGLAYRTKWAEDHGVDVTSAEVKFSLALDAYHDAESAIFQQNNRAVNAVRAFTAGLERPNKLTGRTPILGTLGSTFVKSELPVVNIPTNMVAEAGQYMFGSVTGLVGFRRAIKAGIENLQPQEADLIARQLKKGSVGAVVALLAFLNPPNIGGYYQKNEKRGPNDVKPGDLSLWGVTIDHHFLHHPVMMVANVFGTARRVADEKLHKNSPGNQGVAAGLTAGLLGLTQEVPFVNVVTQAAKLYDPNTRGTYIGEYLKSVAVPQIVQWEAKREDKNAAGEVTKRKPKTTLQTVASGIPGLRKKVPLAGGTPPAATF